jgi:4-hydroxybenzoate polyprenyltransferase
MNSFRHLLTAMRPRQWTKNLLIFLALFLSVNESWQVTDLAEASRLMGVVSLGFLLFCLLSASEYLINDLLDIEKDRLHPTKRLRPLAAGNLSPTFALGSATVMAASSLAFAYLISPPFALVCLAYFTMMLAYSFVLKRIVIIDVFTIAVGFVLRAVAGAVIISVPISPWLYICTVLGALFLGFSKRRAELVLLSEDASNHRSSLDNYSQGLLDQMIAVVAPSAVIAYSFYTFTATNLPANHSMMLTIPFALYGVFRYLYLIHNKNQGGSPEEVLLTDYPLIINIVLWIATAVAVLILFRSA